MKTLYLIDILDDPNYAFEQVFQNFLDRESLDISYYCIKGLHEKTNFDAVLASNPAGIIISGSLQSVSDRAPWMLQLETFIQKCHAQQLPVLGLCFGHQIIASAMGGTVEALKTWEFGVHPVYQNPDAEKHPWLQGLPNTFNTLQVHQDHVSQLPIGATSLAFSEKTPHQVFQMGSLMGVQFHPEYTVEMLHTIIEHRHHKLIKKGPFHSEAHLKAVAQYWQLPEAPRHILKNFLADLQ